jgi:hypothetical protein
MVTPLSITHNVFNGADRTTCILYVPQGSLDAYQQAPVWQEFLNIIEEDAPTSITIHVETAGTLPALIAEEQKYQITELTLTGDLNGTDIKYIREMAGRNVFGNATDGKLAILNLADANIVSGGDDYYYLQSHYRTENDSISSYMFYNCTKLTRVTLPNDVTSIGWGAFENCTGLLSITIPNSVTSIGNSTFRNCSGLPSITIPNGVTSIGNSAFAYCSGLPSITIPNSVTSIENYAFAGCSGLPPITIPNGVTSIGEGTFQSCSGLTSITLPNNVTSIGNYAFGGCSGLISITIPNSVTSIRDNVFAGCTGLVSISMSNSLISLGNYAFLNCNSITSVTLPNSVTWMGVGVFSDCSNLTSVTLSSSLTSIRDNVFYNCPQLAKIHTGMVKPPLITSSVFAGHSGAVDKTTCILYVPQDSRDAYMQMPVWQDFVNIFEENASTGIVPETGGILPPFSIHFVSNGIVIETKEAIPVAVYNIFGQKIHESLINGNREINLNKGVYIVKAKKESQKVIVK